MTMKLTVYRSNTTITTDTKGRIKMNINDLTLGQIKEIKTLLGEAPTKQSSAYPVGKNVIVRTITMIYTGVLEQVTETDFILRQCAWIPETGRYAEFVEKGVVNECEPYPEDLIVYINRGAYLDMCELKATLPRSQK